MPRIDKYDPYTGGSRQQLEADWPVADAVGGVAYGVGLNASGRVVKGAGVTGIIGLLVLHQNPNLRNSAGVQVAKFKAGDWVDVMNFGELVEWKTTAGVAGVPGTTYFAAAATGIITAGAQTAGGPVTPAGGVRLGFTSADTTTSRFILRYVPTLAAA